MGLRRRRYEGMSEQTDAMRPEQVKKVVKVGDKIHGMKVTEVTPVPFGKVRVNVEVPITVELSHMFDLHEDEQSLKKVILKRFKEELDRVENLQTYSIRFKKKR